MKAFLLVSFLLALLSGCATTRRHADQLPAQTQRRHYSHATREYHRLYHQSLRHPNAYR